MTTSSMQKNKMKADLKAPISVEIWSDYLCPWCFIGEWNITNALNELGVNFTKEHRSYQTNPSQSIPESIYEVALKHGMNIDSARARAKQIEQSAKESGLMINMDAVQMVNTFKAHCLVAYAKTKGVENQISDRLMQAAFTEGRDIADIDVLIDIAVNEGLNRQDVRKALFSKQIEDAVESDISNAKRMGVKSVPYYRINQQYQLSGANSKEQFMHSIQSILEQEGVGQIPLAKTCGEAGCMLN